MAIQILCIYKLDGAFTNPHEAICNFGWINDVSKDKGFSTKFEMVEFLENDNDVYIKRRGKTFLCNLRRNQFGIPFLQAHIVGNYTDDLLSIKVCSVGCQKTCQ